ncbi:MAG TPA: helix-turn-helix domain-containing protein [Polyangiaceae bacterium]|nr:helix-turn-helix domain-containing protein [Polyangiaceae bacterium]
MPPVGPSAFGTLLRHFRGQRGMSQLALATRVETTTRHLSYVENGRSRPGRDLVLRLAQALDVPLRTQNDLLVAAGLPAEFPTHALESVPLAPYRRAIEGVITALDPFPAFVIDPLFNLERVNEMGRRLLPASTGARANLLDLFLAPGPARALLENFSELAWSLEARLSRSTASMRVSPELGALRERVDGYLRGVPRPPPGAGGELVVCPTFRIGDVLVRTVGMTLRFGPSRDVTLEELSVDVLYPRDEAADRFFRSLAA